MKPLDRNTPVGVIGAGTMGSGIAQLAGTYGHPTVLYDSSSEVLEKALSGLQDILKRLVEKGRLQNAEAQAIVERIQPARHPEDFRDCGLIIEAIVENLPAKQTAFSQLEKVVSRDSILATNTSSLSITAIASVCRVAKRVLGAHFFNPAPLMPLVEMIPGIATAGEALEVTRKLFDAWGKTTVVAKDTPGFIVNRVARPFYGEALRLLEEGVADVPTIDWAMREIGGFRMGPFELMDFIGNDINLKVTETVFEAFFYDPRYKPSFTQRRMVEAGWLGRKSGRGYYDYHENAGNPQPQKNRRLGEAILSRILVMLINEAAEAVFYNIASVSDIDLAMTRGVNYPRGLLQWADEIGLDKVLQRLTDLREEYSEDRYRPSALLKRMVREGRRFYDS